MSRRDKGNTKQARNGHTSEYYRMERQRQSVKRTAIHHKLGTHSEIVVNPITGIMTKAIPYTITKSSPSGYGKEHVLRNATAKRFDSNRFK